VLLVFLPALGVIDCGRFSPISSVERAPVRWRVNPLRPDASSTVCSTTNPGGRPAAFLGLHPRTSLFAGGHVRKRPDDETSVTITVNYQPQFFSPWLRRWCCTRAPLRLPANVIPLTLSWELATLKPFQPYRYTKGRDPSKLVTQPYDKIIQRWRKYLAASPTISCGDSGARRAEDSPLDNVYSRRPASGQWFDGILRRIRSPDSMPTSRFRAVPDIERATRMGSSDRQGGDGRRGASP
jgi:hypothetical protein